MCLGLGKDPLSTVRQFSPAGPFMFDDRNRGYGNKAGRRRSYSERPDDTWQERMGDQTAGQGCDRR